jgi:hypothetical protein
LGAVVDGVAASVALPEYLRVFESGDDVFDACSDRAVSPVAVVAVAAVAEDVALAGE